MIILKMPFKEKSPKQKLRTKTHILIVSKKFKESKRKMEIKVLCDRCFKDVMKDKVLYKFGSVVYCKKCHEEIEKELFDELLKDYLATKDEERENELAYEIANYKFLRKEA